MIKHFFTLVIAICILPEFGFSEKPEKIQDLLKNEIKLKLNESSSSWTKISFSTQFWMRNTTLNEGSSNKAGDLINSEPDFALRRTRFVLNSNFNDQISFYTQLGFNNLSATSAKPEIFLHDVYGMFRMMPKSCYVGFGLSGWSGLSRLSNTSFQKTMTLDNPGVNYPNINRTDIEGRQLGIFMKGTVGRLSYRAILDKPFVYNGLPAVPTTGISYEYPSEKLNYKGYFAYHFFDIEYFNTPYVDMTYFGAKKICNIGAGFDIYPTSIAEYDALGNRELKSRNLFATDFMLELPFKNNQTISVYSVLYSYDFGKNYLRLSGTMNNWNGGSGVEGAGNNEFKIGTGTIWYTNAGYLFPEKFLKMPGRLQFFYAYTNKNFDALHINLGNQDLGANYYVVGQKLKLSFQYSLRPIMNLQKDHVDRYLPTAVFQVQLAI